MTISSSRQNRSTERSRQRLLFAIWIAGAFAFALTHLIHLFQAGGLHYDEAWAALFSNRIANESHFWPLTAMSPYTSPWSHYWTALFFKLGGTNLSMHRLSGLAWVAAGLGLIGLALGRLGEKSATAIFPWVMAFFAATTMNHRFAIEINTFHVFCLGLFAWGMSARLVGVSSCGQRWIADLAILSSVVLGITSHILFLAPALAAMTVLVWNDVFSRSKADRILCGAALLAFSIFALRIHFLIPEKDKSFFLLLIAALGWLFTLAPAFFSKAVRFAQRRFARPIQALFVAAGLVAAFFVLFFSEGSWAAAFFNGGESDLRVTGLPLVALGLATAFSWRAFREKIRRDPLWAQVIAWVILTWILTAALSTKPAPRYFEVSLVLLGALYSLALGGLLAGPLKKWAFLSILIWIIGGAGQLELNYFKPLIHHQVRERSFRFLFFKDYSGDTLSKQDLAVDLAQSGCRFEQLRSDDARVLEPLRFLSIGDWNASGERCFFGDRFRVQREAPQAEASRLGPFFIQKLAPSESL